MLCRQSHRAIANEGGRSRKCFDDKARPLLQDALENVRRLVRLGHARAQGIKERLQPVVRSMGYGSVGAEAVEFVGRAPRYIRAAGLLVSSLAR